MRIVRVLKEVIISLRKLYKLEVIRDNNKTSRIGSDLRIHSSVVIGKNCKIGDNVRLGKGVVLKNYSVIGSNVSLENITVGENSRIESRVVAVGKGTGRITIGTDCYIGIGCMLDFSDSINIGNFVHFAASTGVWTHSSYKMVLAGQSVDEENSSLRETSPVEIGSNVYVGANCVIYPGVTIKDYSVIAPCSAVAKDIDSREMVGGVPAKFIKRISEIDR